LRVCAAEWSRVSSGTGRCSAAVQLRVVIRLQQFVAGLTARPLDIPAAAVSEAQLGGMME